MILILPGFSIKNKEEAEAIASALLAKGQKVYVHNWRHWIEDIEWNPQEELRLIKLNVKEPFSVVAKSIGTYIASGMLLHNVPDKLILMGIPVNDLTEEELDVYFNLGKIQNFSVIQNSKDPHGNAEQVRELLVGLNFKLITKEASDHSYKYIPDILSELGIE